MTTRQFIQLLESHPGRPLNFEYRPNQRLRKDYHITEVKNVHIEATDCGGRSDAWRETVIQLWEAPEEDPGAQQLDTGKALAILRRVEEQQPLFPSSPVRFEYGNAEFHTGQFPVQDHRVENGSLILRLQSAATQCKAREACGIPAAVEEPSAGCAPGSGCC